MVARADPSRLRELLDLTNAWLTKPSYTRKELQSLLGKLVFASRMVSSARTFTQRCFFALSEVRSKSPSELTPVSDEIKADLRWWVSFLPRWNGVSLMLDVGTSSIKLASDASLLGFGGVCDLSWISAPWPEEIRLLSMSCYRESLPFLELFALTATILTFAARLQRQRLSIASDSKSAVDALLCGYSHDPLMLALIREIHFTALHSFTVYPTFIPGHMNIIFDALSRLQTDHLLSLMPNADSTSTPIRFPTLLL